MHPQVSHSRFIYSRLLASSFPVCHHVVCWCDGRGARTGWGTGEQGSKCVYWYTGELWGAGLSGQHIWPMFPCLATKNTQTYMPTHTDWSQPFRSWSNLVFSGSYVPSWQIADLTAFKFRLICKFKQGLLEISQLSFVNIPKLHLTLAKQQQKCAMHFGCC